MNYIVQQLPAHLFWDSDLSVLDDVEHYEKIIIRAFERGDLEDMATVMAYYGKENCREVLVHSAYLAERALLFASLFLSVEKGLFLSSKANQHHLI
jgi:hypothetical protein